MFKNKTSNRKQHEQKQTNTYIHMIIHFVYKKQSKKQHKHNHGHHTPEYVKTKHTQTQQNKPDTTITQQHIFLYIGTTYHKTKQIKQQPHTNHNTKIQNTQTKNIHTIQIIKQTIETHST